MPHLSLSYKELSFYSYCQSWLKSLLSGTLKEPEPCYMASTRTGLSAEITSFKDCVCGPLSKQRRGSLEREKNISTPSRSFWRALSCKVGFCHCGPTSFLPFLPLPTLGNQRLRTFLKTRQINFQLTFDERWRCWGKNQLNPTIVFTLDSFAGFSDFFFLVHPYRHPP